MSQANDDLAMAVFCDFENVALGVRDAQYDKFDIKPILERLLLKGSIVVKKAYCDWERYKSFKAAMHEANFELIEIPHVRQSGKNSADIRLVVDALDLCYTKAHVDTFVIVSGDSDFSPLVSKLRENAKRVIGVGVKQSTSDLLIANCDEFIYYDDLVRDRESRRGGGRRNDREAQGKRSPEEEGKRKEDLEARRAKGIEMAVATVEDLLADRADNERVWASVVKEALKRRNPGFNESYYGFRAFGNLLEEAAHRGLLDFGRDERSGAYVTRRIAAVLPAEPAVELAAVPEVTAAPVPGEMPVAEPALAAGPAEAPAAAPAEPTETPSRRRRGGGRGTRSGTRAAVEPTGAPGPEPEPAPVPEPEPVTETKPKAAKVPKAPKAPKAATATKASKPSQPRARRRPKATPEGGDAAE